MPAKDKYHDAVVNALKKDGWVIESEQVRLVIKSRYVYLDIQARNEAEQRIILIEVKGFENLRSFVSYLSDVVGQYMVYTSILNYLSINYPLYLAVPQAAYESMLQEEVSQQSLKDANIHLLIFDPIKEDIIKWQN